MSETDDSIFMTEDDYREDREEQLRAEITSLRAQLEEARAKAIEECAKIAETFAKNHGVQWGDRKRFELHHVQRAVRGAGDLIAEDIRALLSAPTEARSVLEASNKGGKS